jgi:hypothetical protein
LLYRKYTSEAQKSDGFLQLEDFVIIDQTILQIRKKLSKPEKGIQNPARFDNYRAKFMLWIIKVFEFLPSFIDKDNPQEWILSEENSIDSVLNSFSNTLTEFLNQGMTEVKSVSKDMQLTLRLIESKEIRTFMRDHFYNKRHGREYREKKKKRELSINDEYGIVDSSLSSSSRYVSYDITEI